MKKTKPRKDPRPQIELRKRRSPPGDKNVTTPMAAAIAGLAADLTVVSHLQAWSKDEKLLLAAMLPEIRRIIKTLPAGQLAKLVGGPAVNIKVKGEILRT